MDACMPKLNKMKEIILKKAVHPYFEKNNQEKNQPMDRISFSMDTRMIVISGPNAGGKNVINLGYR